MSRVDRRNRWNKKNIWLIVLILALAIDLILLFNVASASPIITDWYNNKTGDTATYIVVGGSTGLNSSIYFNVTANETITTWNWVVNNNTLDHNYDNLSWVFGEGYNWVRVYGVNANGATKPIEWHVYVMGDLGSAVSELNTTTGNEFLSMFDDENRSFTGIIEKSTRAYRDMIGNLFFVLFYGIIFLMMWIRQGDILIPSVIGLILGSLMIAMLPAEYHMVAVVFVAMGVFAVLYTMFKSRY